MVEHQISNLRVAGSRPVFRSQGLRESLKGINSLSRSMRMTHKWWCIALPRQNRVGSIPIILSSADGLDTLRKVLRLSKLKTKKQWQNLGLLRLKSSKDERFHVKKTVAGSSPALTNKIHPG